MTLKIGKVCEGSPACMQCTKMAYERNENKTCTVDLCSNRDLGNHHAFASLFPGKSHSTYWTSHWVGPRLFTDMILMRQITAFVEIELLSSTL
jgi:hypothetical protein